MRPHVTPRLAARGGVRVRQGVYIWPLKSENTHPSPVPAETVRCPVCPGFAALSGTTLEEPPSSEKNRALPSARGTSWSPLCPSPWVSPVPIFLTAALALQQLHGMALAVICRLSPLPEPFSSGTTSSVSPLSRSSRGYHFSEVCADHLVYNHRILPRASILAAFSLAYLSGKVEVAWYQSTLRSHGL